jgi:hypothetical protein
MNKKVFKIVCLPPAISASGRLARGAEDAEIKEFFIAVERTAMKSAQLVFG